MEAKIHATNNNGQRIFSNRMYGYGFEWVAPRYGSKTNSFYYPSSHTNVGKALELNKWYVLGL